MQAGDYAAPWYHGSPHELSSLRKGSWITQYVELAKAFAHKPALISLSEDISSVKHNGKLPGFLYAVDEPISAADAGYLRDTAGTHYLTQRDLRVRLVAALPLDDPPQLSPEEIAEMRRTIPEGTTGFVGSPDND